ncbi:MAG: ABC transporter permease [Lachnospiraceae bacterium]|nr:ABC transporter permease [Lachnospiraceae bacterium]
MRESENDLKHIGRFRQLIIYLNKLFRLFVLQNDWKVLPMSAVIAGLVSLAVGRGLFRTMEGTFQGTFALTCVCIWNGFFNSIQSICRERAVIKREHRAGMHITSYVGAQLIYQALLCAAQCAITIFVLGVTGVAYPQETVFNSVLDQAGSQAGTGFTVELFITLFLVTYAADLMALMISAIVHSEMAAMTVMPFMLIIQLVFSGFIALPQSISDATDLMISKWGVQSLCVISDYNELPAVMIWNRMSSGGDRIDIGGGVTIKDVMNVIDEQGMKDTVIQKLSETNQRADFEATFENLFTAWIYIIVLGAVFAVITVVFLEFIDRDKR